MNDSTKCLYREILDRYVKVVWTHKIHLCQANLHTKRHKQRNTLIAVLSILVSATAITNIFKWLPECVIVPLLAVLSLTLTFFTTRYKGDNLEKAASENEHFAAKMHHLRNCYAGLLSDIKAGLLSDEEIVVKRNALENEEGLIYSSIVPMTSTKAVKLAEEALKTRQESTTTNEEIQSMVPENLQID